MEKLYRYSRGFEDSIRLESYHIVEQTKKGVWIIVNYNRKWVSMTSKKRFAYPTEKEALHAFIMRTTRCIAYVNSQLKAAKAYLAKAKSIENEGQTR